MSRESLTPEQLRQKLEHWEQRMSRLIPWLKGTAYVFLVLFGVSLLREDMPGSIIAVFVVSVLLLSVSKYNTIKLILRLRQDHSYDQRED